MSSQSESLSVIETVGRLDTNTRKQDRVRSAILAHIHAHRLAVGDRLPPERDLARQLRVSYMTARQGIGTLSKEGVLRRIHGKGVFVAKRLKRVTAAKRVAVLYQDKYNYENSYLGRLIPELQRALGANDYEMAIVSTTSADDSWMRHSEAIEQWRQGQLCGVILASHYPALQVLNLAATGIPYVWVGNTLGSEPVHAVVPDNVGGILSAVRLLQAGGPPRQQIHLVGRAGDRALADYREHVVDAGLAGNDCVFFHRLSPRAEAADGEVRALLDRCRLPVGLFVQDCELGEMVLNEVERRDWNVPDQVSIVVHDFYKRRERPRLVPTVLEVPFRTLAQEAVRLLGRIRQGTAAPGETTCVKIVFRFGDTTYQPNGK